MSILTPLNDYVILTPVDDDDQLLELSSKHKDPTIKGEIVHPGRYDVPQDSPLGKTTALSKGDIVYYVRFSGEGQTVVVNGQELVHVKYERLMSRET